MKIRGLLMLLLCVSAVATVLIATYLYHCSASAKPTITRQRISVICTVLETYKGLRGRYPAGDELSLFTQIRNGFEDGNQRLLLLEARPREWNGGRMIDGWGNPIHLVRTNEEIMVQSFGPNRIDDGGKNDDVAQLTKSPKK